MAPKGKSSSSSATRKKHAAKAAKKAGGDDEDGSSTPMNKPLQRGEKKNKKEKRDRFAPKIKSYTPPPPPPKGQPDPVDLYLIGQGKQPDPELVVVLRRLMKKDEATVGKGVNGLEQWVRETHQMEQEKEAEDWEREIREEGVVDAMAVWAHHFPRLALHPSRRLRLQVHALHSLLLNASPSRSSPPPSLLPQTRSALLAPLWVERSDYIGAWAVASWDTDRSVRREAKRSWESVLLPLAPPMTADGGSEEVAEEKEGIDLVENAESLAGFALSIVRGGSSSFSGTDTPIPGTPTPSSADLEDPAFLRTSALLALSYLLSTLPCPLPLSEGAVAAILGEELWSLVERGETDQRQSPKKVTEQPPMVRRAVYEMLEALAGRKEELLVQGMGEKGDDDGEEEDDVDGVTRLRIVSSKVLANCWGEEDGWAGIVAFLRRYPQAWELADSVLSPPPVENDYEDEESGSAAPAFDSAASAFKPSPTLTLLLTHLSLGCSSHPAALYPTILLLLSTLPTSILPPTSSALSLLFEHFWAAYSCRALSMGGRLAQDAWASAMLECVVYELSRAEDEGEKRDLAREWIGERLWRALLGTEEGSKPVASRKTVGEYEKALTRLAVKEDVFEAVWEEVKKEAMGAFAAPHGAAAAALQSLALALPALVGSKNDEVRRRAVGLVAESVRAAVGLVQQADEEKKDGKDDLLRFISEVKDLVKDDELLCEQLDALSLTHLRALLPTSSAALTLFVSHLSSASHESRIKVWTSLFSPTPSPSTLLSILDALPDELADSLPSANLDDHLLNLAYTRVFPFNAHPTSAELSLLQRVTLAPSPLASSKLPVQLLDLAASSLPPPVRSALSRRWTAPPELDALVAPASLLAYASQDADLARRIVDMEGAAVAIFDVAFLLPEIRLEQRGIFVPGEAVASAQQAWTSIAGIAGAEIGRKVLEMLRERITDSGQRASPVELVEAVTTLVKTLPSSSGIDAVGVLPSKETIEQLYSALSLSPPPAAFSIVDPLVSAASSSSPSYADTPADDAALTPFSRALIALLDLSARDHSLLRRPSSSWALPHLLVLAQSASDELLSPSPASSASGVFGADPPVEVLERVAAAADGASSYLLSSLSNAVSSGWHAAAVTHLRSSGKEGSPSVEWEKDALLATLEVLFRAAKSADEGKSVQAARAVKTVLSAVLRYSEEGESVQDAERWLALAQTLTTAPTLSSAILFPIKPVLFETPRFSRYQNELAASLAGVKPHELDTKALPLLQQLLASAPPLDAPIIFLPQQRTVFLVQAVSRWIGSEEVLPEGLETGLVELFGHFAPIIQDLSGSHWDLMFDLVESSLDSADWVEPTSLPGVYHACRLIALIQELSDSNADLRQTAKARIDGALELVLGLFVSRPASLNRDKPRELVVETMAGLVKDLPPKLLSMEKSFSQLLRLIRDQSIAVQLSSYDLLRRIVAQHVSDLVVETELDTEEKMLIEFPAGLVKLVETPLKEGAQPEQATSYLFAWMTAFAFFESASPRLRNAYIEQLRNAELIISSLLPSLFALLNLSDRTRPVDLSSWFIDVFHFEYFDASSAATLPVLAAHVYYRALQAVPSIIRVYWTSLQNLALSRTIQSFTSKHFSPLLIADELDVLRDPSSAVGKQLRDNEDFVVKVAANGSEVKVTFTVDEENMELGVKVPNEFPLAAVEVRDVRKVGVTDKQWRAWLLAMQQVITSQSAAIADALLLFKRNATLHFEGVESCAICYSTVAASDRSLPTKPCKNCNNRFHASCLYKWFTTSGGSSCPLCRQIM
ncbi:hypothetical protein JCM8547_005490 [Rhodosporidiobolus lusitaniae]